MTGADRRCEPSAEDFSGPTIDADYVSIWREGFDPHQQLVSRIAVEPGYYGVYYGTDEAGMVDFLAGMVVGDDAGASEELELRRLPGGRYARFDVTLATIGAAWAAIFNEWLPGSGYAADPSRPALEYFAPDMGEGPEAPVAIYVAVALTH